MPDSEDVELIKGAVKVFETVYDDALHPLAVETGKALGTLGKVINVALAPLRGVVWSYEKIEGWLTGTIEQKLESRKVPKERITTPDPDVAVPAIEALRYSKLRNEYANLIATAMDSATSDSVHPSFVEILKQLTPLEARLLQRLPRFGLQEPLMDLKFSLPEKGQFLLVPNVNTFGEDLELPADAPIERAIDNLCRVGLTDIPAMKHLAEDWRYDRIRALPIIEQGKAKIPQGASFITEPKMIGLTILGEAFRDACIDPTPEAAEP